MIRTVVRFLSLVLTALALQGSLSAQNGLLSYNGDYRDIEGEKPFNYSYSVAVTGLFIPALPAAASAQLQVISLARPAGVSEATALSFITLSQPSLSFTGNGSGQTQNITISINVPAGNSAGDYAYRIKTTGAWSNGLSVGDNGTLINLKVKDPGSAPTPPVVDITFPTNQTQYTYNPAAGPLQVPFTFTATNAGTTPILSVDADLNGSTVAVTASGLNTTSATGTGTLSITAGGLYTLRARASNGTQTSSDTVDFTVVVNGTPPTVVPTLPVDNSTYTFTTGGSVSIPISFTTASVYGGLTAISATLNGTPVSGLTTVGLNTLAGSALGTLNITTAGTYSLVYSASNTFGTTSKTLTFSVNSVTPKPVVTITNPAANTVITRTTGTPATSVPFSYKVTTPSGTITAASVTLNGVTIPSTVTGLNTVTATGTGNFSVTNPGTYTIVVTGSNGTATASATQTFTVKEVAPIPQYMICWLPPISYGQTIDGGDTMPIYFTLWKGSTAVRDTDVVVAIYEIYANGTTSPARYYTYGDYAISYSIYNLKFKTSTGAHRYKVEVYTSSATSAVLIGSKEITTRKDWYSGCNYDNYHRDCDRDHRHGSSCYDRDDDEHSHWGGRSDRDCDDRDRDDRDREHDRDDRDRTRYRH